MSNYLAEMVELFFIVYYIPRTMTRLARARNRSALLWSLTGIGAFLAGEFIILLVFGAVYGLGVALWGWPEKLQAGLQLMVYVTGLGGGGVALMRVEHALDSRSQVKTYPVPPPPPEF